MRQNERIRIIQVLVGLLVWVYFLAAFWFTFSTDSPTQRWGQYYWIVLLGLMFVSLLFAPLLARRPTLRTVKIEMDFWIAVFIGLCSLFVGMCFVNKPLFHDEYSQLVMTSGVNRHHFYHFSISEAQPPIGYLHSTISNFVLGVSHLSMRLLSILPASFAISMFYLVLIRIGFGRLLGILVCSLMLSDSLFMEISVYARPYAYSLCLQILFLLSLLSVREKPAGIDHVLILVVSILYAGSLTLQPQLFVLCVGISMFLVKTISLQAQSIKRLDWMVLLGLFLVAPSLIEIIKNLVEYGQAYKFNRITSIDLLQRNRFSPYSDEFFNQLSHWWGRSSWFFWLGGVGLLLVPFRNGFPKRSVTQAIFLGSGAFVLALPFTWSLIEQHDIAMRYLTQLLPILYLFVGLGLYTLTTQIMDLQPKARKVAPIIVALTLCLFCYRVWNYSNVEGARVYGWKKMYKQLISIAGSSAAPLAVLNLSSRVEFPDSFIGQSLYGTELKESRFLTLFDRGVSLRRNFDALFSPSFVNAADESRKIIFVHPIESLESSRKLVDAYQSVNDVTIVPIERFLLISFNLRDNFFFEMKNFFKRVAAIYPDPDFVWKSHRFSIILSRVLKRGAEADTLKEYTDLSRELHGLSAEKAIENIRNEVDRLVDVYKTQPCLPCER